MEVCSILFWTICLIVPNVTPYEILDKESSGQTFPIRTSSGRKNSAFLQSLFRYRRSSRVCFGAHGCFSWKGDFYDILKRPIIYNPYFETSKIKYALYTRNNTKNPQFLKISEAVKLNDSFFDPSKKTKLLVHGWTQLTWKKTLFNTKAAAWMWDMKDALLNRDDVNVIVVDWTVGSDYHYMKAAPNARLAGADIALLVKVLELQTGAIPEEFHIIGHGLGAQVAGYAGTRMRQMGYSLGRISGLDPVKTYFQGMARSVHLDPSDADFVDVIHTNGAPFLKYGIGVMEPSGHVDFYANKGRYQPGCLSDARCSHIRAYELYMSSIGGLCTYQAKLCFKTDESEQPVYPCGMKNVAMGYDGVKPDEEHLSLYIKTKSVKPYCQLPDKAF